MKVIIFLILLFFVLTPGLPAAQDTIEDIRQLEKDIVTIIAKVTPAFVKIGGGSGICISPDGYVLTNHHVAGSLKQWTVEMPDSKSNTPKSFKAKLLAQDPRGDICLLQITADEPLPYVPLGDSDALRLGQPVIALGNPFMFAQVDAKPSISFGIVSALHKMQGNYTDAIQTDASINPGNSGGPLITTDGKLIGINGQIAVRFGNRINTGVGYAVPVNQIKNFMSDFKKAGGKVVKHGHLNGLKLSRKETAGKGAVIENVRKNSSAAKAGFKKGDMIVKFGKYKIYNSIRFYSVLGTYPAGTLLTIKVMRQDKSLSIPVKLEAVAKSGKKTPGLGIIINPNHDGKGVKILRCHKNRGADIAGLGPGDIILTINGKEVNKAKDITGILKRHKVNDKVTVEYLHGGTKQKTTVILGKPGED
ncbi:trypsin-like peptidase domain-containing protein [Planctomycetota bacterium]